MDTFKPKTHFIKIDHFLAKDIEDGKKTFEIRLNDRGYQRGDIVEFQPVPEIDPKFGSRCYMWDKYIITYVLNGYGLKEGYVAFGIMPKKEFDKLQDDSKPKKEEEDVL